MVEQSQTPKMSFLETIDKLHQDLESQHKRQNSPYSFETVFKLTTDQV
jgi:hypothetical protein